MSSSEDQTIRVAIGGLIAAAQSSAVVYAWNVLSHNLSDWPGLFGANRFGAVIKRVTQLADRKNASRDKRHETYDIWAFYKFRPGKTGDNSDDEFAQICQSIYDAIKASPHLGLDTLVEYHELVQWIQVTTIRCGEETLHYAAGRLKVNLCC
jgi:hypothetical protein